MDVFGRSVRFAQHTHHQDEEREEHERNPACRPLILAAPQRKRGSFNHGEDCKRDRGDRGVCRKVYVCQPPVFLASVTLPKKAAVHIHKYQPLQTEKMSLFVVQTTCVATQIRG